jgi:hypothetical protein
MQVTITSFHILLNSLITGHPIYWTLHSLELLTAWQYAVWATDSMTMCSVGYWQHDTTQSGLLTAWQCAAWATDSMTLHSLGYLQHDPTQNGLLAAWNYAACSTYSMILYSVGLLTAWHYTVWSDSMTLHRMGYWLHESMQPGLLIAWHYTSWSTNSMAICSVGYWQNDTIQCGATNTMTLHSLVY